MNTASGTSLCGAISFTAGLPGKWVARCHCTRCRRAYGAAFVTWIAPNPAALTELAMTTTPVFPLEGGCVCGQVR